MRRRSLAIGICFLMISSGFIPISLGYNIINSDEIDNNSNTSDVDMINFSVINLPERILVNESGDCWINQSTSIQVSVYGGYDNHSMNASIEINGCGLDVLIDEETAIEDGYWIDEGVYSINISPKHALGLTIIVSNMTYNLTIHRNFTIKGLIGFASTSIRDDKLIILGRPEQIIFDIWYGQYADVHLTWVNKLWNNAKCINKTSGDNTAGNGQNGIFNFNIDKEDLDNGVGYIIIVGKAGGYYNWDAIEIRSHLTLFVGGSGPGNYTKIQDAIDNASYLDTVYVYDDSSPYYENVKINKSITLLGEDMDTTIIDGSGNGDVVSVYSCRLIIRGFTIQNTGTSGAGIRIYWLTSDNIIKYNNILNNRYGIFIEGYDGFGGPILSERNIIIKNNFINNEIDAYFILSMNNQWMQNYWNKPRILPKLIFGKNYIELGIFTFAIPWINIDLRPALIPYDI